MRSIIIEQGLTSAQVEESKQKYGINATNLQTHSLLREVLWGIVREPMFLLLLITCIIYFALGQLQDGFIMFAALLLVSGISVFQNYRSNKAVLALNKLATPKAKVFRNNQLVSIPSEEIVVGDIMLVEEGMIIQADGEVVISNDLTVNQSILTGESFAISKSPSADKEVYKGTLVTSGGGRIAVSAIGINTRLGQIGAALTTVEVQKTPLQLQIHDFVRKMVIVGILAFAIVVGINLYMSGSFNQAFLQGLTLAMSILPEEIPVAFSTFQALGAYRLLKKNIIVKHPQYVETLGAATVICVDKTGTLTQNKMEIVYLFDAVRNKSVTMREKKELPLSLIEYAMWSSETSPFDPMEKAIHNLYGETVTEDQRPFYKQVHEYPLDGVPPMMTHIFSNAEGRIIIAVKGAPEAVLRSSNLPEEQHKHYLDKSTDFARKGYRVLAVGKADFPSVEWPEKQEDFVFNFLGLIVFEDPLKPGIQKTIESFSTAGINVKMITGDYADTAIAIALQAGLHHNGNILTGDEVMALEGKAMQQRALDTDVFVRMFPQAKLKVVNALKEAGEIVAMTGDGVNDAPALKAAHIGVAMGQRGSEVAKNAAALILINDDLNGMTEAISLGRKIYDNLKKAIQYIISIHIPIILIVTMPLLLGWDFINIFSPVHVIFLELIMGPTCSIIYENEPVEAGTMTRPPRKMTLTFLSFSQLFISILQGLAITAGCLGIGYYFLDAGEDTATVRTMIFITLLFSNIFLTQLNRSFVYPVTKTIRYNNAMVPVITLLTLMLIAALLYWPWARDLFRLHLLSMQEIVTCAGIALLSTGWLELVKWRTRNKWKLQQLIHEPRANSLT